MNREEKIAGIVQRWIPDELRLDSRHDAKLVSSAITTVIMAVYDSDRITMKAQSSEVNSALKQWFDTTFTEHMRAEDDHMKGLEEKASRAMPVVSIVQFIEPDAKESDMGIAGTFDYTDSRFPDKTLFATVVRKSSEGNPDSFSAYLRASNTAGKGDSPASAFANAVVNSGAMVRQ